MEDCVFCQIVRGEIPAEKVCESELVLGFKDIHPSAPTHFLFVPKKHVLDLVDANDQTILEVVKAILKKVKELGLVEQGYRIVANGGSAKAVPHLHWHLLAPVSVTKKV